MKRARLITLFALATIAPAVALAQAGGAAAPQSASSADTTKVDLLAKGSKWEGTWTAQDGKHFTITVLERTAKTAKLKLDDAGKRFFIFEVETSDTGMRVKSVVRHFGKRVSPGEDIQVKVRIEADGRLIFGGEVWFDGPKIKNKPIDFTGVVGTPVKGPAASDASNEEEGKKGGKGRKRHKGG